MLSFSVHQVLDKTVDATSCGANGDRDEKHPNLTKQAPNIVHTYAVGHLAISALFDIVEAIYEIIGSL